MLCFHSQCKSLMEEPSIILNADAVALYLSAFDETLLSYIYQRLLVTVTAEKRAQRRLEDPYLLEEVMEAAMGADMGPTVQALYKLASTSNAGSRASPLNASSSFQAPLAIPFAKELPKSNQNYLEGF